MRTFILFILFSAMMLILSDGIVVRASDRKFPYEAIVNVEDGEFVRSGPGPKYYPTVRLRKGDRVIVHRHDPGGWCMIAPPAGSFSWVRAEYVQKSAAGDTGVLKSSGVVVHIGSSINPDDLTTVQANLSKGDAVEILGEKNFNFDDGSRLMYKISPVKREWRWITRKSIDAADSLKSEPFPENQPPAKKRPGPVASLDSDAFAQPVSTRPASSNDEADRSERFDQPSSRETAPGSELTTADRTQLDVIDRQFRNMVHQDPSTWDLDSLDRQYSDLDDDVDKTSMTNLINLRRDAVRRYRKTHQEYVDFFKITSESKQRDAQLKAIQSATSLTQPPANMESSGNPIKSVSPPVATNPAPTATPPAFDGAGIVQKMAQTFPGGPQFVLITPEGRMLSFLRPAQGVDLSRHVGRAMGITGQRVHRDDWNADVITVRSLQPVQLRGTR